MHLVALDILKEAQGLSYLPCSIGILLGLVMSVLGWWGHRFWLVLVATLSAGIFGLWYGPTQGVQPIVAGVLMAIAAGALVLDTLRVVAFVAGALTAYLLGRQLLPGWNEPFLLCFIGGFSGLLLFRYWLMALFSYVGVTLWVHSLLVLLDKFGQIDCVTWSRGHLLMLDVIIGISTAVGFMIQFYFDRKARKKKKKSSASPAPESAGTKWWRLRLWGGSSSAPPTKTKKAA